VEFDKFADVDPVLVGFVRIAVAASYGMQFQRNHTLGWRRAFAFELGKSFTFGKTAVAVEAEQLLPSGFFRGEDHGAGILTTDYTDGTDGMGRVRRAH
jgi:hypothetical protein